MKFLSKPSNYDVTQPQQYIQFSIFRLALTHRNWAGSVYATRQMGEAFLDELTELDKVIHDLIGPIDERLKLDFLMDVSVFAEKTPENTVLIDFLEELEDFKEDIDETDIERNKIKKAYIKKLRYHSSKLENATYLYRWAYLNPDHPFAANLKSSLDENIERVGSKLDKEYSRKVETVLKSVMVEQAKEQIKKNSHKFKGNAQVSMGAEDLTTKYKAKYAIESYELSSKPSSEFIRKIFTFGLGEPTLFFFGLYALNLFFKKHDFHINKSRLFILFKQINNQTDVSLIYSTPTFSSTYLNNEFLIKEFEEKSLSQGVYKSITNMLIPRGVHISESEKVDVLKTIAEWAIGRIDFNKLKSLPFSNSWIHHPPKDFLSEYGIKAISIRNAEVVGGPNGDEWFIKGVIYDTNGEPFMFPIFDSESWNELNSLQCAVIAYSICLIHDMLNDKNYRFVPIERKPILNVLEQDSVYKNYSVKVGFKTAPLKQHKTLLGKDKNETKIWIEHMDDINKPKTSYDFHVNYLYDNELQINHSFYKHTENKSKVVKNIVDQTNTSEDEKEKRNEYWVSFHFRRLRSGKSASEDARQKAIQYGVKRIPKGFTFVSGHTRGESTENGAKINISALDVLNKTIGKINAIDESTPNN